MVYIPFLRRSRVGCARSTSFNLRGTDQGNFVLWFSKKLQIPAGFVALVRHPRHLSLLVWIERCAARRGAGHNDCGIGATMVLRHRLRLFRNGDSRRSRHDLRLAHESPQNRCDGTRTSVCNGTGTMILSKAMAALLGDSPSPAKCVTGMDSSSSRHFYGTHCKLLSDAHPSRCGCAIVLEVRRPAVQTKPAIDQCADWLDTEGRVLPLAEFALACA